MVKKNIKVRKQKKNIPKPKPLPISPFIISNLKKKCWSCDEYKREQRIKEQELRKPVINITLPNVNITQPPINITQPAINVTQPAPIIHFIGEEKQSTFKPTVQGDSRAIRATQTIPKSTVQTQTEIPKKKLILHEDIETQTEPIGTIKPKKSKEQIELVVDTSVPEEIVNTEPSAPPLELMFNQEEEPASIPRKPNKRTVLQYLKSNNLPETPENIDLATEELMAMEQMGIRPEERRKEISKTIEKQDIALEQAGLASRLPKKRVLPKPKKKIIVEDEETTYEPVEVFVTQQES